MNNVVTTLAPSLYIESSSFLQVIKTKSLDEFAFKQIRPQTVELAAIERLECLPLEIYCDTSSTFIFELIFLILAEDNYERFNELDFGHSRPPQTELAVIERLPYNC